MPSNISEWCVHILKRSPLKLHPHFASNCCQVASLLNAQPLCMKLESQSQSRKEVRLVKEFEIYSLTIYSQKNIFWLSYQQLREKLFQIIYPKRASCFRSSRNLYERYQFFVLIVYGRLRDYFSPLYIENKVSSRMTFAIIFFPFYLFQGTAKPQNRRGKVKTK